MCCAFKFAFSRSEILEFFLGSLALKQEGKLYYIRPRYIEGERERVRNYISTLNKRKLRLGFSFHQIAIKLINISFGDPYIYVCG